MLDHLLGLMLDVILLGSDNSRLVIRGVLLAHPTLTDWYHLTLLGRNAFVAFEVDSYGVEGRSADGYVQIVAITKKTDHILNLERRSEK